MLEVAQMAVINRGTCAAGRTGDKVKQVERVERAFHLRDESKRTL